MIAVLTQPDGDVTVTDGTDVDHLIPSFPALQKQVAALVDELSGEVAGVREVATQVTALANAAAESASEAAGSADAAAASAQASEDSNASAAAHRDESANSAAAAEVSNQSANSYANASQDSASASARSAGDALAEANRAASEADDSAGSASAALVARGEAVDARDLAQAWAVNPENVPIAGEEFSSKHWALKAREYATGSLIYLGSWDASTGSLPSDAKKGAFYKISGQGVVDGVAYRVGDNIIHNGTGWDLIDNTESVTAVAGKVGNVTLGISDIVSLTATLDGKASVNHSHAIADVVGLQASLDAKVGRAMETTMGDKISLYGDRAGRTDFHGFGVEDSTTYYKSGSLHRWYCGANADGTSWTVQLSPGGMTVKGVVQTYRGAVGTQQILLTMGWGNLVQRINQVIESDGAYSLYTYDAAGGTPSLDMRLSRGGSVVYNGAVTSSSGGITSKGAMAAFWFQDRSNGIMRALYSDGDVTRVWNGVRDIATFYNSSGDLHTIGWMYAPNFKIESDSRLKSNMELLDGRQELERLKSLVARMYDKHGKREHGFYAQDVLKVYPSMVEATDGAAGPETLTLQITDLIAPIVAAIQELERRLSEKGI